MSSHIAQPDVCSPNQHGWKNRMTNFSGPMASELLEVLICSCPSRGRRTTNCACNQINLGFAELYPHQRNEDCGIPMSHHKKKMPLTDKHHLLH